MHIDGLSQSCTSNFQLYTRFIRVCVCIHTRGKKKRTTTSTYPRVRKQGGRRLQWRRRMREIEEVPVMCVTRDEFFIVPTYSLSSPFLATHCAQQRKKKISPSLFEVWERKTGSRFVIPFDLLLLKKKKKRYTDPCPPVPSACNSTRRSCLYHLSFVVFNVLLSNLLVVYIKLYWLPVYLCADKPNKKRTFLFIQPVTYRLLLLTAWPMCLILHITGIDLVKNDSPTT